MPTRYLCVFLLHDRSLCDPKNYDEPSLLGGTDKVEGPSWAVSGDHGAGDGHKYNTTPTIGTYPAPTTPLIQSGARLP